MAKTYPFFPNLSRDCSWESPVDEDGVQVSSSLNSVGMEVPDPTPMAPPVGMTDRPSLADFVHRMIRQEVERNRVVNDMETFDEADDFDVEDDPLDPLTPYEKHFEPKTVPEDWPMYFNAKTGLYGQLPPGEQAPDGFELLEREKQLPKGWTRPDLPKARTKGKGRGGEEGSHPAEPPADPPLTSDGD